MVWKERPADVATAKPAVSFAISLPVVTVTVRAPGVSLEAIVTVTVHWVSVVHCWLEKVMPVPKLKIEDEEKCVLVPLNKRNRDLAGTRCLRNRYIAGALPGGSRTEANP